jgi:predicted transcriptional regulator of viral defense system
MMIYNWDEMNKTYGYPLKVREALGKGEVYRIARGLYSYEKIVSPFSLIAIKYPYSIITMDTACFIHGLTDVIPEKTYLATKRNATRINDEGVVQVFLEEKIFEPGKTKMMFEGSNITIYNSERLLVEVMRNSKSLPFDYYKEVIAGYRRIVDKLDFQKIEEYIYLFKRKDYLFNILQREVL